MSPPLLHGHGHPDGDGDTVALRERFAADHAGLELTFARLLEAFDANDRDTVATLWTQFEAGLLAHMEVEEKLLVPALFEASERDARTILAEHRHIRSRVAEIATAIDLHTIRADVARAFIDELRAHAHREDDLLYGWTDRRIDDAERITILHTLAETVRERLARAHH